MMRGLVLSLLLLCACVGATEALSTETLPDSFHIQTQTCKRGCFDLMASGKKVRALRPAQDSLGSFYFFDSQNQRQLTLKYIGEDWNILYFDVYDKNRVLIAKLQILPTSGRVIRFYLLATDAKTVLASGVYNLLGTTTVYAGTSWDVLATLTHPFFAWGHDGDVTITNQSPDINTDVLAAAMVMTCLSNANIRDLVNLSISYNEHVADNEKVVEKIAPPQLLQNLQSKLKKLVDDHVVDTAGVVVTNLDIQAAAEMLNQRYREIYDDTNLSEEEQIKQFVAFGCGLIQSHTLSPVEEQAMLQFLISRLS